MVASPYERQSVTATPRLQHSERLAARSRRAYQLGMSKRIKLLPQERGTVLFDVVFTDGSRASSLDLMMRLVTSTLI